MKKLMLLILLLPVFLLAQPKQLPTSSTRTLLLANATFTGALETIPANPGIYDWLLVVVRSNVASVTNGLIVRWSDRNTGVITYTTIDKRSYVASDSLNGANTYWFPISGSYFKISYTNGAANQTGTFSLSAYLKK